MAKVGVRSNDAGRAGLVASPPPVARRPSGLVKLWAGVGIGALALVLSSWIRWITSSDFKATPSGPDEFDGGRLAALRSIEVLSFVVAVFLVYRFLIRPLLRERRLTYDGQIVIIAGTLWFTDPLDNYFNFTFAYNTHFLNMGSWTMKIPGWESPHGNLFPEPILMIGGTYLWWIAGFAMAGCALLRLLERRRPQMSWLAKLSVVFVAMTAMDFGLEMLAIHLELWAYPAVVKSWSVFAGTRHQFPLYEAFFVGLWCAGLTALRYFRDDRGRSFAERGIDTLKLRPGRSKVVSFLALTGLMHAWMLVAFYVPYSLFAVKADTWAPMPSYMRAGICGEGTEYACPHDVVPVPDRNSLHIGPDDPNLPASVRDRQGVK